MSAVVQFHTTGGPEVLRVEEVPDETPGPNQISIRVDAFGINRAECMLRRGVYAFNPLFPCKIGTEGAGTVEVIGQEIHGYNIGDPVAIIPFVLADANGYWKDESSKYGTYGEIATVPAGAVVRVPDNLSSVTSAASWMQYLTAWGGLVHYAGVTPEDTVLVTAASSSAALGGLQLCKDIGARVIAVTRSEKKVDRLLAAGADNVLVSNSQELAPEVLEITNGRGATVIYDPIAGPLASNLISAASPEAKYICYGDLSPAHTDFSASEALTKRINMKFYSLYDVTRRPELLQQAHEYVYHRLENNIFQPIIDTVFHGLTSATDAHRRMESNAQFGKIVVKL